MLPAQEEDFAWPDQGIEGDREEGIVVELEVVEALEEGVNLFGSEPDGGLGALVEFAVGLETKWGEQVDGWGDVVDAAPHFDG